MKNLKQSINSSRDKKVEIGLFDFKFKFEKLKKKKKIVFLEILSKVMQKTFKAKINKKSKDEPKIVYSIKLSEEVLQLLEEKAPAAINLETNVCFFFIMKF